MLDKRMTAKTIRYEEIIRVSAFGKKGLMIVTEQEAFKVRRIFFESEKEYAALKAILARKGVPADPGLLA